MSEAAPQAEAKDEKGRVQTPTLVALSLLCGADGKVDPRELRYITRVYREVLQSEEDLETIHYKLEVLALTAMRSGEQGLELLAKEGKALSYETRKTILYSAALLMHADGAAASSEIDMLDRIGGHLGFPRGEIKVIRGQARTKAPHLFDYSPEPGDDDA